MKKICAEETGVKIEADKDEIFEVFKNILFRVIGGAIEFSEAAGDFEEYLSYKVKKKKK